MQAFVFDTYALLEIIAGNPSYAKYLNSEIVINDFIFAELCYKLIRENGIEVANFYVDKYAMFRKGLDAKTIKEAMMFRVQHKKKNLSPADCISYVMALKLDLKFLTGDMQFENMENVEFVK
ncbi:PIN domain-containing protein [Candidatus Woesearchaeota archaeon]|nr:PIN domain-containing protein [Candidatus Woesearchaeota archaeon]